MATFHRITAFTITARKDQPTISSAVVMPNMATVHAMLRTLILPIIVKNRENVGSMMFSFYGEAEKK